MGPSEPKWLSHRENVADGSQLMNSRSEKTDENPNVKTSSFVGSIGQLSPDTNKQQVSPEAKTQHL